MRVLRLGNSHVENDSATFVVTASQPGDKPFTEQVSLQRDSSGLWKITDSCDWPDSCR
jgi:hypothetical protein